MAVGNFWWCRHCDFLGSICIVRENCYILPWIQDKMHFLLDCPWEVAESTAVVQLLEKLITLLHWSKSLQNQMDKLSLECLLSVFFFVLFLFSFWLGCLFSVLLWLLSAIIFRSTGQWNITTSFVEKKQWTWEQWQLAVDADCMQCWAKLPLNLETNWSFGLGD